MNLYDRVVELEKKVMNQQEKKVEEKLKQEKKMEIYKTQRILLAVIGIVMILSSFLPLILSYLTMSKSLYTDVELVKSYACYYFITGIILLIVGLACIVRIYFPRINKVTG